MAIILPHSFNDNVEEPASGKQVNENFDVLREAIEGIGTAQAQTDALQAGVIAPTDWLVSSATIDSGTCALGWTASVGGAAWLPGAFPALTRTFTPPTPLVAKVPPVVPAPGGFMMIGFELSVSGGEALVTLTSGPEKGSEAEGLLASPATTFGRTRIRDLLVKNVGGVYSAIGVYDRRPWARGAYAATARTAGNITPATTLKLLDAERLSFRVECSGTPLAVRASGSVVLSNSTFLLVCVIDGSLVSQKGIFASAAAPEGETGSPFALDVRLAPAAGSHLFQLAALHTGVSATIESNSESPLVFSVEETVRANANNGTG